jgi:ubiquinone/menaquinone biosynthesis C-methylase UbiE
MGSIAFDRAAEYYDRTRELKPDTHAAVIVVLLEELRDRGRCLEIGVGTGRIALDLHRGGVPMTGIDLSMPMLRKLVEKAGGAPPFPLAVADATALPLAGGVFASAVVCHVLHLIPLWQRAVGELIRTVRPGGVILIEAGADAPGIGSQVVDQFFSATRAGQRYRPGMGDIAELDELMRDQGLPARDLRPVVRRSSATIEDVIGRLESGILSGCWTLTDEERASAAATARAWARERFGRLDESHESEGAITWRAYDVPSDR